MTISYRAKPAWSRNSRAVDGVTLSRSRRPAQVSASSQSDADAPHALDPPNAGCQFRALKTGVGGVVRDASDGRQPQIDCRRRKAALFEVDAVSEHHGVTRLGAFGFIE
jgi:hypothetical protein